MGVYYSIFSSCFISTPMCALLDMRLPTFFMSFLCLTSTGVIECLCLTTPKVSTLYLCKLVIQTTQVKYSVSVLINLASVFLSTWPAHYHFLYVLKPLFFSYYCCSLSCYDEICQALLVVSLSELF